MGSEITIIKHKKMERSGFYLAKLKPNFNYVLKFKSLNIRVCIQTFPNWQPGARTVNGRALCH
jgi:hypothetical protein